MPEFWNALDHREQALLLVTAAAIVLAHDCRRRSIPLGLDAACLEPRGSPPRA
jgi:hypothetical protein